MRSLLMAAVLSLLASAAFAVDSIQVNQLTPDDITMMQRGWSPDIGQCGVDIAREINIDNGDGERWYVILDDNRPEIVFERVDGGYTMICQTDGIREIGTGAGGAQKYDQVTPYGDQ